MWLHYCTLIGWEIWQNQHSDFHPSCLLSTVSPERIGWCFWTIRMNEGLPLVHSCTSWLLTADFVGYDLMTGWGALSPTRFAAGLRLGGSKAHNRKPEKAALAQSPWVHRAVDGDVSTPLQHETQRRKLNHLFFVWLCFCRYSELATFIPSQICHEKNKKLCSHVTFCWWPRISAFKRCSTWWCKLSPTLSLEVSWTNWKPCRSADPQISTAALWLLFRWATKRLVDTNPTGSRPACF